MREVKGVWMLVESAAALHPGRKEAGVEGGSEPMGQKGRV